MRYCEICLSRSNVKTIAMYELVAYGDNEYCPIGNPYPLGDTCKLHRFEYGYDSSIWIRKLIKDETVIEI